MKSKHINAVLLQIKDKRQENRLQLLKKIEIYSKQNKVFKELIETQRKIIQKQTEVIDE